MPSSGSSRGRRGRATPAPVPIAPPVPLRDSAFLFVALLAGAAAAGAVTSRLGTADVWQHLLVGKAIWQLGRVPQEHLWTWPLYGTREVLPAWGFSALLWPSWLAGGAWGMQVWRWLTTLAAFGLGLATARRLGARGFAPLAVIGAAAITYRARGQVRPETLAAVLIALQIWVLERRRARGGGALALVVIAWVWANVHASYVLGLALTGIHALSAPRPQPGRAGRTDADALAPGAPPPAAGTRAGPLAWLARLDRSPLWLALAASIAISFVNPFGWRALAPPFESLLAWRHLGVGPPDADLAPLPGAWRPALASGWAVLAAVWPLLAFGRALARRFDLAESLTCVVFVGATLWSQRFSGALAIALVPYLSRDLSELAGAIRWPSLLARPPARAAAAAAVIVAAGVCGWYGPGEAFGVGFVDTAYPGPACDFIQRHGIRGRMFNPYPFGGYLLWRFWPERDRLPFTDAHRSGTPRDRELYDRCFASPEAWNELMQRHAFDVVLLDGRQGRVASDHLLDRLDVDPDWALVFRDDASAIYLRRSGAMGGAAERLAYRVMPGGAIRFAAMGDTVASDPKLREMLRLELERRRQESPFNATAYSHMANIDFIDNDRMAARRHLDAALQVDPRLYSAHRRIGYLWLAEGAWGRAIEEFEKERAVGGPPVDEYTRMGECWEKLGDRERAIQAYRRQLEAHPDDGEAHSALLRLGAG